MSRILEGIFVLSCAFVGLGISAPDGSVLRQAVERSTESVVRILPNVLRLGAVVPQSGARVRLLIMKHVL